MMMMMTIEQARARMWNLACK